MPQRLPIESGRITSVDELSVGDGLYTESSDSVYWVTDITGEHVTLAPLDGAPCRWYRDTLEASFAAHTWVRQSRAPTRRLVPE